MLVKCIIKVFLYLILAVMTLIHWFKNSDDIGKYFALLFYNIYIYSKMLILRCFSLSIF